MIGVSRRGEKSFALPAGIPPKSADTFDFDYFKTIVSFASNF
jgi:hypothetical protein